MRDRSCQVGLVVIHDDPDDDRILECALTAEAHVIVSGDRHLLRFKGVAIMALADFHEVRPWER